MSFSVSKFLKEYHIIIIIIIIIGLVSLYNYFQSKGKNGHEKMSQNRNKAYNNSASNASNPRPAQESGNEVYSSVGGSNQGNVMNLPPSCNKGGNQNPADLLPKDTNSQWAQLNPAGKGDLANINLLKAGYHIGIDTIGQTLRNANLQIRSEPPNPQVNVGPWNLSTIDSDFMRPPLEIGQGSQ
jgi:hypothetical protein